MRSLVLFLISVITLHAASVTPEPAPSADQPFLSPDVWANPMEDWQSKNGRWENTHSGGNRNIVSLTAEVVEGKGYFSTQVTIDQLSESLKGEGFVGFQIGLQGVFDDYRDSAIYGVGLCAGVDLNGHLFIGESNGLGPKVPLPLRNVKLSLAAAQSESEAWIVRLTAANAAGKILATTSAGSVHASWLKGLVSLTTSTKPVIAVDVGRPRLKPPLFRGWDTSALGDDTQAPIEQARGGEARFAFSGWSLEGPLVTSHPERRYGPIMWTTHTLTNDGALRLLVQMAPVCPLGQKKSVTLKIGEQTLTEEIDPASQTALFYVPKLDTKKNYIYEVNYLKSSWGGVVRAIPQGRVLTLASMSCNDSTGFPHVPLVKNIQEHKPDVITFHGDQIYESIGGYGNIVDQKDNFHAHLCYLRKYYMHGWSWRDVLRDIPSITIPDDHDVMHGNIWGEGGKLSPLWDKVHFVAQDAGGYKMGVNFVNAVHRSQTGQLPTDEKENTPCESGISTYHCQLEYGDLDFLILADRQFKSAPKNHLPEADINNGWPQNLEWNALTDSFAKDAQLLGKRQEAFLKKWAETPAQGARIVISQSPFLAPQTLPKDIHHDKHVPNLPVYKEGEYAPNDEPKPDFDTNGWPQQKQKLALQLMKQAGALHITGDQHLGTTGQYGIESYDDGPWWIASPAIANVWPRRWMPSAKAENAQPEWPRWKGGFIDGFGNKFTMHAVANPMDVDREPSRLWDRAVGYAITKYDPSSKKIEVANWPYLHGPKDEPFPGWPVTIKP